MNNMSEQEPNYKQNTIFNLFPTPVARRCINREFTTEELEFINSQEKRVNESNTTSINNYVLEEKQLKDIKDFLLDSARNFFVELCKPNGSVDLYITQSWLNYTDKNQYHHKHMHPNSFISGVFYINADPLTDKIVFYRSPSLLDMIKVAPTEHTMHNSETWWLEAGTGLLYLFRSDLPHSVPVLSNDREGTRISLSFNTFLEGTIGDHYGLTSVVLEKHDMYKRMV
jgi:uncharacterized protein (TIGR02466 family)